MLEAPEHEAAVGVGLREQRRRGTPLHVEDAGGLHRVEQPEPSGLVLRAGVDGEERHGARAILLLLLPRLLLQRVCGSRQDVAEGAVRAELHRVGVAAEMAGSHIHPQTLAFPRDAGGGGGKSGELPNR